MKQTAIKIVRIIIFLAILASFVPIQVVNAAGLCYVNDNASGSNNGSSWANAYTSLQSAISDTCTEIWVTAGTYKPHASDRTVSFTLENGVSIYGGFAGTETLLSERDFITNVTILSGDLLGNDSGFTNNNENSYHVVVGSGTNNTATLDGFTIRGGNANTYPGERGGGVYNFEGSPTLTNIIITGNTATYYGGGIYNVNSDPSLTKITISGNTSYDGGGIYNLNSSPTIVNVSFSSNTASNSGGAVYNDNSSPSITDSSFDINSAGNSGGGMHNDLQSNPSLTDISFTSNTAGHGGGLSNINESDPSLTNVSFLTNAVTLEGGGMYNSNSSPVLTNVTFTSNQAPNLYGGGIYSWMTSNPTLTGVTFNNNSALRGGGMYVGNTGIVKITNTTFENNSSTQDGGGLFNEVGATTNITNSTFFGNSVSDEGGAIYNSGTLTLINATISNSSATDGGGIFNLGTLNYSNSIIANTSSGGDCFSFPAISTNITNLVEDGSCAAALTGDPLLGSLANNGGSTHTMALLSGSPAIDAGDDAICAAAPVSNQSQNGVMRPRGSHCDIGSYEKSSAPTTATFGDVPMNHPYWLDIEILYANGFTGGCSASPLLFCPDTTMDRAQGAVFMLRGLVGTSYVPPVEPFANPFGDSWAPGPWAQRWAQGMLDEGLTAGCSTSPLLYCPWEQMPRAQAAVFGMRLLNGSSYLPPAGTGTVFADINGSEWYAGWAEQAYLNGLLPACGMQGSTPLFCPNSLVSRGLGAYMIVRARNLSMP